MSPARRSPASPALATALALAGLLGRLLRAALRREDPGRRPRPAPAAAVRSRIEPIRAPSGTPQARIAVELQNDLIYDLTGGAGQTGKTHQLTITLIDAEPAGDRRHHHGAAGRPAVRHQRELYADRDRHRQAGGDGQRPSRACPTTIPASSSASPTRAASATPKIAPPRSFRITSSRGWRPISPPGLDNCSEPIRHGRAESGRRRFVRRAPHAGAADRAGVRA